MNALAVARGTYGAVLVTVPDRVVPLLSGRPSSSGAALLVRVLGVRQLAQAATTSGQPAAWVWKLGVAVDATHALSAVGLAATQPRWRRAGLTVAVIASAFAVSGMSQARRA